MTAKRIVIVGGGAGGLELACRLGRTVARRGEASITLIDASPTHLWKPLLHQVAAGMLNSYTDEVSFSAEARLWGFNYVFGRMDGLDAGARRLTLASVLDDRDGREILPAREVGYDILVLAVGSAVNDFGTPGVAEHAHFLDDRPQAEAFHRAFMVAMTRAAAKGGAVDVVIVGGGATGVELAAELRDAATAAEEYGLPGAAERLGVTLVERAPRLLGHLDAPIGDGTAATLGRIGVRVLVDAGVNAVTRDAVNLEDGRTLPADLVVWAAGVRGPAFLGGLRDLELGPGDRLVARPTLQTSRRDEVYALGDCALARDADGTPLGPRAQVAQQEAVYLAKALRRRLRGEAVPEFRFHERGTLVSLSRFAAYGSVGSRRPALVQGLVAHVGYRLLYRAHQIAVLGVVRTGAQVLVDVLRRSTHPRIKMHGT